MKIMWETRAIARKEVAVRRTALEPFNGAIAQATHHLESRNPRAQKGVFESRERENDSKQE